MSSHSSLESEASILASSELVTQSFPNAKQTRTPEKSSDATGPMSRSTKMSAPTSQLRKPTSSVEDSHARTSPSQENGLALQVSDQDSSLRQHESLTLFSEMEDGFSLRMFPDSFPATTDEISESFSRRWPSSGFMTSPGECWTADTSECHSEGGEFSSLPSVLEADVQPRFFLSPRAAAGIIRRAEKRGKALPPHLDLALRELSAASVEASGQQTRTDKEPSSLQPSLPNGEKERAVRQETSVRTSSVRAFTQNTRDEVRYIGETGNHTGALAAQAGMKQTNYLHSEKMVRRLTPTECERLQGFPDGWTIP